MGKIPSLSDPLNNKVNGSDMIPAQVFRMISCILSRPVAFVMFQSLRVSFTSSIVKFI